MSEKMSQCNVCKEPLFASGNYSVTIIPSKRIPKKARKVHLDSSISAWGMTKFQKYLVKRSTPTNFCEIRCDTCQTTCKIPMTNKKKLRAWRKQTSFQAVTPLNLSLDLTPPSIPKRKKKKGKEVNAGLIIPESFNRTPRQSSSTSTATPTSSKSVGRNKPSARVGSLHRSPTSHKISNVVTNRKNESKLSATKNALQKTLLNASSASSLDKFFS